MVMVTYAMMTDRNTPHQDLGLSAAEMYGWSIKDHLPILHEKHQIHKGWRKTKDLRERAMAKRHLLNQKQYNMQSPTPRALQISWDHIHSSGWKQGGLWKLWATGNTVYSWMAAAELHYKLQEDFTSYRYTGLFTQTTTPTKVKANW